MRYLASVGLVLCLGASVLFGRPGSVKTKDGRNMDGDITDNGDTVTIAMKAASITLPRGDVESITYAASIEEQYKQRLAALPSGAGARSHLDLARWLYDNKAYALARTEATTAIELEPNNADAVFLRQAIDRSIAWEKNPAKAAATSQPADGQPATTGAPAARAPRRLLTLDQINAIRQHEVKESERLSVRFDNNVIRRYIESEKGADAKKFNSSPSMVKAMAIMKNPDLRKDVHILTDPAALAEYRKVQPFLLAGCATTACHGGTNNGGFALVAPADSDAVTYTNFYIFSKYTFMVDNASHKLIDRQQPANSLLLEFARPREAAKRPHPEAVGFAPIFRNDKDLRRATLTKWLGSLTIPEPDYGIDFPVQPGGPASRPTTQASVPKPAAPADRPANAQNPPPGKQQNQQNPQNQDQGRNNADDALKEIRPRLRPIRPF